MIISRIMGGLGNQLFAYAVGLAVARSQGQELKLDLSDLGPKARRRFGLGEWLESLETPATKREIVRLRGRRTLMDRWRRRRYTARATCYQERLGRTYDPAALPMAGEGHLDGYWQCESFFLSVQEELRRRLCFRGERTAQDQLWAERLGGADAVAVHVRAGDYFSKPGIAAFYGNLGEAYYRRAKAAIRERNPGATFHWFCDEPDWLAQRPEWWAGDVIVSDGRRGASTELWLMSRCHHHMVANSTYSWWGAWLGSRPGQRVLAPVQWLQSDRFARVDTIPERWERIPIAS